MTKKVQLYFKSENDAESVRSKLHSQKANNVYIDEMPNASEADTRLFAANEPAFTAGAGTTGNTSGSTQPITVAGADLDDVQDREEATITHLLTFDVKEENLSDVMIALKDFNYYTDSED